MARNRQSAKKAGTSFERLMADYLSSALGDSEIDRQVKTGARDVGDIRGVFLHGKRVTIECKEYGGRHKLPEWLEEAEVECSNADSEYAVVIWKRKGTTDPAEQYVTMTAETFAAMCCGGHDLMFGEEDGER